MLVATCVADLNTPLSAISAEDFEGLPCQCCGLGKCELLCRALGCDVACHARCFTVDQDKWPSVMGDYNGITLRRNDDLCGTWVCPEHVVSWVYSKLPGGPPPPDVRAHAVELEHVRQLTWFYSRSSEATINKLSSAVKRIRKFEDAMGVHMVPSVYEPELHSGLAAGWYMAWRASKVKVQSLGADSSAIGLLYAASGVDNPFTRPERGLRTSLGSSKLGLSHVLGEEKTPTARLTMSVVLAAQEYCLRRTKGAVTSDDKLYWLYTALYIVVCTMAFLRPNELTKVTLHGMWTHSFTHERARALNLQRWYLGIAFGEQVLTARGLRTVGAMTKVSRRGQKFDADGRGSDVVIVARSENGLVPGRIVDAILQLRGVPLGAVEWPAHLSRTEPLLLGADAMSTRAVARDKRRLKSSGGNDALLPRVRAVLLYLQHTGHPDLLLADVPRITNYWMKITGASEAASRKVPEYLHNGQGRWRLLAKESTQMVQKYIQSTLDEKLTTSDFGAAILQQL